MLCIECKIDLLLSELIVSTQLLADALTEDLTPYPQAHHKSPMEKDPWLDTREFAPTHMDF
jgi:hypothetical protein